VCFGQVFIFGDEKYNLIPEILAKVVLDSVSDTFSLTDVYRRFIAVWINSGEEIYAGT